MRLLTFWPKNKSAPCQQKLNINLCVKSSALTLLSTYPAEERYKSTDVLTDWMYDIVRRPFSRTTLVRHGTRIGDKEDGGSGDNWSYKGVGRGTECRSRQIVTTNKPTPGFLQAACSSCRITNRIFHGLAHPKLTWKFSNSWLDLGNLGAAKTIVSPLMSVPTETGNGCMLALVTATDSFINTLCILKCTT